VLKNDGYRRETLRSSSRLRKSVEPNPFAEGCVMGSWSWQMDGTLPLLVSRVFRGGETKS
jgi:hypothetical protein